jgi:hypothetical protein
MAMGNRCFIQGWGGRQIYPNLFVLLLSPSGFYRKSTAAAIGINLLESLDDTTETGFQIPGKFTPESLFQTLEKRPTGLILWNEFSGALRRLHRDYMSGALEDLTDLYDSPDKLQSKTIARGTETIRKPCVSIIGCSTKDWLSTAIKQGDLRGGFLSRFLFVSANSGDKDKWIGEPVPPLNQAMRQELLATLRVLTAHRGVADFSQCADGYNSWLEYSERQINDNLASSDLIGLFSRQGLHVKKLALLLQASKTPGNPLLISDEALNAALYLFEGLSSTATSVVSDMDWDGDAQSLRQIKSIIAQAGGTISRQELLRIAKMRHERLNSLLQTLQQSEEITVDSQRTGERGRPSVRYQLTGFQPEKTIELSNEEADYLSLE